MSDRGMKKWAPYSSLIEQAKGSGPLPKVFLACASNDPALFCNESFAKQYSETLDLTCRFEEACDDPWGFWDKKIEQFINWLPIDR